MEDRIKKILGDYEIGILNGEKEIIETLNYFAEKEKFTERDKENLTNIERYLKIKSKMIKSEVTYNFFSELAERIKMTKTRKGDRIAYQVDFFKIKDKEGNEYFSLTREKINDEISNNKEIFGNSPTVSVVSQENSELYELLENIKEMF